MSPMSRAAFSLLVILLGACGEDKVSGVVEVGDTDASLEIFLPDGTADSTIAPPETVDNDGDASTGDVPPCPGCTASPCENNGDCNSGYCLEGPNGKECVRTCQDECPTGYACRGVTDAGGDPTFLCLYEHISYCQPCNIDGDCETGIGGLSGAKCLPGDADEPDLGSFCRTPCTAGSCPAGATCEDVMIGAETKSLCRPGSPNEAAECMCSSRSVALTLGTDCSIENALGICDGERICAVVGPVPACNAVVALAEACNDQDDDCDGETDEDFPTRGEACDGDDDDKCQGGIFICANDGTLGCTDDATSDVERCDGADNDCDGETDESFTDLGLSCDGPDADSCKDGLMACDGLGIACDDGPDTATSGEELCNGVDDNCNIQVDEGFEDKNQPCDGDDGDGCKDGLFTCAADGLGLVCNDDGSSKVELCNELDDDCQNGPDDTFIGKLGPCDGLDADECPDGILVCAPDLVSLACTDDGVSKIEVCNDLDDDCDGGTDEDFALKGEDCDSEVDTDLCETGKWVCGANTLVCDDDAASLSEVCNGQDDDCDGLTDGMDGDLADELNPNQLGLCAGSVQACAGAQGYVPDYSAVAGYDQPESPNGSYADENCDGLDGDAARAAFVVVGGPNSGTCTKTAPCGSVTYAITQTNGARPHVYVQAGTYTEVVDIPSGVNVEIYGGFNSNWVRKARTETGHKVTLKGMKHAGDGEFIAVRVRSATVKLADLVVQGVSPGSDDRKNGQGLSSYAVHALQSTVTLERVEVIQGNGATGADGANGTDAPSSRRPANRRKEVGTAPKEARHLLQQHHAWCRYRWQKPTRSCSAGTGGGHGGDGGTMDAKCGDALSRSLCGEDRALVHQPLSRDQRHPRYRRLGHAGWYSRHRGLGGLELQRSRPGGPGGTPAHGVGGRRWSPEAAPSSAASGTAATAPRDRGQSRQWWWWWWRLGRVRNRGPACRPSILSGLAAVAAVQVDVAPRTRGGGGKSGGSSFGVFAIGGGVTVLESRFVLGNGGSPAGVVALEVRASRVDLVAMAVPVPEARRRAEVAARAATAARAVAAAAALAATPSASTRRARSMLAAPTTSAVARVGPRGEGGDAPASRA